MNYGKHMENANPNTHSSYVETLTSALMVFGEETFGSSVI